jgi:hypothetical protein
MIMTLREWQKTAKLISNLIYNCSVTSGKDEWVNFPIGLGWSIIKNQDCFDKLFIGEHNNLVLCAISALTDKKRRPSGRNRLLYLRNLHRKGIFNYNLNSKDYFNCLSNFKFIISPEGNGIDCHRHYEALIAGSIPIIEENSGIRNKYYGCPILFTKDYSEITPEYLNKCYNEMIDKEWDFSRLFLGYYSEEIQKEIKKNGNFWSQRLSGLKWYKE